MEYDVNRIIQNIEEPIAAIDQEAFSELCLSLLTLINQTRRTLVFPPYDHDRAVIFINELYYAAMLHQGKVRKDGSPEFESHLVGTVKNLLTDQKLTGLTSLLSGLKHDDVEDLHLSSEKLFRSDAYIHQLKHTSFDYLKRLQQNVSRIVSGTTKVKRQSRKQTKADTFRKLLEFIRDHGIRVGYVKIADRTHNMETLQGHGEAQYDKQADIAFETERIFIPLSRLFKLQVSEERLTRYCMAFFNPKLLAEFEALVRERERRYLLPHRELIREQLVSPAMARDPRLINIYFEPVGLPRFLENYNITKPFSQLDMSKIPVDSLDPLYEVLIIVDKRKHIVPFIGRVLEKFAVGRLDISAQDLGSNRGSLVRLYNKRYGGRLFFRINDAISEARSHRGLLADIDDKNPPRLRQAIAEVIETADREGKQVIVVAGKELLTPPITVYTPRDEPVELPSGATALDFAAKIHEDVLKGAQIAFLCDNVWGTRRREISLFDPLPDGVMVHIETCLASRHGRVPQPEKIRVQPSWLLFCHSSARSILARFLRSDHHKSLYRGHVYLRRICYLFNVLPEEVLKDMERFKPSLASASEEAKLQAIGRGEYDLVGHIAKLPFIENAPCFTLEVILIDQPLTLATFVNKLGPLINLTQSNIDLMEASGTGKILLDVQFDRRELRTYDFLRTMLRLQYQGYALSIVAHKPKIELITLQEDDIPWGGAD